MKRSQGDGNDLPKGPVWERPAKRNRADDLTFMMRLDVDVPGWNTPVRVVVDPWTTIREVINDIGMRVESAVLYIRGVRCNRSHRISRYTNTRVTPARLEFDDDPIDLAAIFGIDDKQGAAAPSTASGAAPTDAAAAAAAAAPATSTAASSTTSAAVPPDDAPPAERDHAPPAERNPYDDSD